MNFHDLTIGQAIVFITGIGVIIGAIAFLVRSFDQIQENKRDIIDVKVQLKEICNKKYDDRIIGLESQKILLEETNTAVNLLCQGLSALIDNAITGNNIDRLKSIKNKLDEKKEIV